LGADTIFDTIFLINKIN